MVVGVPDMRFRTLSVCLALVLVTAGCSGMAKGVTEALLEKSEA